MRELLRGGWVVCGLMFASGCSDPPPSESSTTAAVTSGSDCVLTPIDDAGTLPACAAGTSTAAGPGLPGDFIGSNENAMPITGSDQAALDDEQALDLARNPPGQPPADLGFGVAP